MHETVIWSSGGYDPCQESEGDNFSESFSKLNSWIRTKIRGL